MVSREEKQYKHILFGLDFPRTVLILTPGCPWVKKFLPITRTAEKRTFWCGHPRLSTRTSMTRRDLKKLCTKKVWVDFLPLGILDSWESVSSKNQKPGTANIGTAIVPLSTTGTRHGSSVLIAWTLPKNQRLTRPQLTSHCREAKRKMRNFSIDPASSIRIIDLLMCLFRGSVFHVPDNSPF